jgi:hypothetical protein
VTLEDLLERLGDRADVTVTSAEWVQCLNHPPEFYRHGLEPTTKLALIEAGIVAWLLPVVTGRDEQVPVRVPEIERRSALRCANCDRKETSGHVLIEFEGKLYCPGACLVRKRKRR